MDQYKNLLFLDFDGVCNSFKTGSYLTHEPSDYGVDPAIIKRLREICKEADARIVISSNWRRYAVDGKFTFDGKQYVNPLRFIYSTVGDLVVGTLPLDRHISKSEALTLWFEDNSDFKGNYAILDDDRREGFQWTSKFVDNFWLVDAEFGLTEEIKGQVIRHLKRLD